jgi:DNA polymerase III subunit epsilon
MNILNDPLVFVDIETTGMSPTAGRVIEVAAIRVEQGAVTQTLNTLLEPGVELPYFITRLTGISDHELRSAPVFSQIADELHKLLDGAIFVAHNVRFDYSFLQQEFSRVGLDFAPRLLCTVRLSRALYPEHKSHKLSSLIERHGFSYQARHRAFDDAHILWQFMQHVSKTFEAPALHAALSKQLTLPALPQ